MQVDSVTLERYKTQAPELLASVVQDDGECNMKRDPHTDYCVKLDGGLCGIQSAYGEEFLGNACALYPRLTRSLGTSTVMAAAPSCPEIVRLALTQQDGFALMPIDSGRSVSAATNFLPDGINDSQAIAIHTLFLDAVLNDTVSAERSLMCIFVATQSLSKISPGAWPDAVPFYLQHAELSLPSPDRHTTDPLYLLQSLCGLVAAAKYAHNPRLMQTVHAMEAALHATIRMDTLAIATLPDQAYASEALHQRWDKEWKDHYATVLRRYTALELSLAFFPFAGFGNTLSERIAIIGIRLATVKLALMGACAAAGGIAPQTDTVRVIQSLSRFLDHLAEPEFSLRIYTETGWLQAARLRGLLDDRP